MNSNGLAPTDLTADAGIALLRQYAAAGFQSATNNGDSLITTSSQGASPSNELFLATDDIGREYRSKLSRLVHARASKFGYYPLTANR